MYIQCPYCHQAYDFPEEKKGQIFTCIECDKDFIIGAKKKGTSKWFIIVFILITALVISVFFLIRKPTDRKVSTNTVAVPKNKEPEKGEIPPDLQEYNQLCSIIKSGTIEEFTKAIQGKNPNLASSDNISLLMYAVQQKRKDMIEAILGAGADIDFQGGNSNNAAAIAAQNNDLDTLEYLIQKGIRYNGATSDTPVGIAAEAGFVPIVAFFTSGKVEFNEYGRCEKAIFRAIKNKHIECVRLLLPKYNMEDEDLQGNTILAAAIISNSPEIVRMVLQQGGRIDAQTRKGIPMFLLAILTNNPEMIAYFPKNKINPDLKDTDGNTIPILCAQKKNWSMMKEFLSDSNKNCRNRNGYNVLFYACANNAPEEILLVLTGYSIDTDADTFEQTPLYAALISGNYQAVRLLFKAEKHAGIKDAEGNTVLILAAAQGSSSIVQYLLSQNAIDIMQKNKQGKNAFEIALEKGHSAISGLLKNEMNEYVITAVKQKITVIEKKFISPTQRINDLDTLKKKYAAFEDVERLISAAIEKQKNIIKQRDTHSLALVISKECKNNNYSEAIKNLEDAMDIYSQATNIEEAKIILKKIKENEAADRIRKERIAKLLARVQRMSQSELQREIKKFIDAWLSDMQVGKSTESYWYSPILASSLYSVKSWNILKSSNGKWGATYNKVNVIIESSTKGGFPIRKIWKVTIMRDDNMNWKISDLTAD